MAIVGSVRKNMPHVKCIYHKRRYTKLVVRPIAKINQQIAIFANEHDQMPKYLN